MKKYYAIEVTYRKGVFTSKKKAQAEINKLMRKDIRKSICQIDCVDASIDEIDLLKRK